MGIPPSSRPPKTKGGKRNTTYKKLREKMARREYARPSRYTSEFRRDFSNVLYSNRGSQRQRWQSEPGVPFGQAQRGKWREGKGYGASETRHGTSTFGLSYHRRLLASACHAGVWSGVSTARPRLDRKRRGARGTWM